MPTKTNSAGNQQNYIPAGTSRGGEFTFNDTFKNYTHNEEPEKYSKKWFENNYDSLDLTLLVTYTDMNYAHILNKAIRENNLTNGQKFVVENIVKSINKNTLDDSKIVYRGITVDFNTYYYSFLLPFRRNQLIVGSTICSTSENYSRALQGALYGSKKYGIVFTAVIPKGFNALPISNISRKPDEREILLSSPKCRILSIKDTSLNNLKEIVIKLER